MKRLWTHILLGAIALLLAWPVSPARADDGKWDDGKWLVGADVGFLIPTNAFKHFGDLGGVAAPYVGYMFTENLGVMGQLQAFGVPGQSQPGICSCNTWAIGAAAGPRIALPLGDAAELYGTIQGGFLSGLNSSGAIDDTSGGFSTGGGINFPINDTWSAGVFARWNRWSQGIHGVSEITRYVTTGITVQWNSPPPPPPPPPPVAVVEEVVPPPPPPKRKIVLRGVTFAFDKSIIRPEARPVLDEAIRILKEESGVAVIAAGYTDSIGTEQYNMGLSIRRANAVKDYLVAGGISPSRIRVEGFGEADPVASNATPEGRAQNRRVELRVVQ